MKPALRGAVAALFVLSVGACQTTSGLPPEPLPSRHVMQASFNPDEAAHIHQVGSASIEGTLSVPDRYDGTMLVPPPGSEIRVYPDTAFARERISALFGDRNVSWDPVDIIDDDRRFKALSRVGRTDETGHFRIDGLPAGTYFVVGTGFFRDGARLQKSALLYQKATLAKGQALTVTLDGQ